MNPTVDTNVLVRAIMLDDPVQSPKAVEIMKMSSVVIALHAMCETIWVLRRLYGRTRSQLIETVEFLLGAENIVVDRPAFEAGLTVMRAGGDFADGVIAFEGARLGGKTFVTFDRKAASILSDAGTRVTLLSGS